MDVDGISRGKWVKWGDQWISSPMGDAPERIEVSSSALADLVVDSTHNREFKERMMDGCRFCGTKTSWPRYEEATSALSIVRGQREAWGSVTLSEGRASICIGCFKDLALGLLPYAYDRCGLVDQREYERVKQSNYRLAERVIELEDKLADERKKKRARDARRKETRKAHDRKKAAQAKPTIKDYLEQGDWSMLRVIFSEDATGLRLIALLSHQSTPAAERRAAKAKLLTRRDRWRRRPTTPAATRNTQRGTKSPLSLASSQGE